MTGLRIAACLLAFAVAGSAEAKTVSGTWQIKDLVLNIYDCKSRVCGRIVWLQDAARRRSDCGRVIVWGLAGNGPNKWDDGSIVDPDDDDSLITLRGSVVGFTTIGADEVSDRLAMKYMGVDSIPKLEGEIRVIVRIQPDRISNQPE